MEQDKFLSRGEFQVGQLRTDLHIPERDEQTTDEVHRLTTTVAKQQDKIETLQKDTVEDAKTIQTIHGCLNQLHSTVPT